MIIQPGLAKIEGFIKIFDPVTKEILVDKKKCHSLRKYQYFDGTNSK